MIGVGIGGWVYAPWRGTFYPPGLPHARELEHAGQHLTAIEVNGTFYSRQRPATFARWRDAVPEGFVFALKGSRFCTNRRKLAEAGEAVANFVAQGIVELGSKLGPINWQLADTKAFDPDDIAAFLALLPRSHEGVALRYAIEPRHPSFDDPAFAALVHEAGVAVVLADADTYPQIDIASGGFRYARLQRSRADLDRGYPDIELDAWAAEANAWTRGGQDGFVFFIAGAKERAPAAAQALIARLG